MYRSILKTPLFFWIVLFVHQGNNVLLAQQRDVILHMFNYPFEEIERELSEIAQAGFGRIQISPPQLSNGDPWWGRYQPLDFRIIDGPLGNEQQLKSLIDAAEDHGIEIIADIVLNHMANLGAEFSLHYPPQWVRETYNVGGLFSPWDFHAPFCISNYNNWYEVQNGRLCGPPPDTGLPDLNLTNPWVLSVHRSYIKKLNDLGIKGYRVDAVKHMPWWYINEVLTPDLIGDKIVFGEIIANEFSFDGDLEPYLRLTRIGYMDFPLQTTLNRAFSPGGSLHELIDPVVHKRALAWDRAVTFVINHDIPNNQGFRYLIMDPTDEVLAYAYVLGRDGGVPHVFSDLGIDDGRPEDRWKRTYKNTQLASMIQFHNQMIGLEQKFYVTTDCVLIFSRGEKGIVGINKCGETTDAWIQVGEGGVFQDTLSNESLSSDNGWYHMRVPGRSAVMMQRETE